MSIKIYNAYRVKSFEEAFAIRDELYGVYRKDVLSKLIQWRELPLKIVFFEQCEVLENSKKYNVTYKWDLNKKFKKLIPFEIQELYRKKDVIGQNGDPFDLSASVVLYYDAPSKTIVLQFFGINNGVNSAVDECFQKLIKEKRLVDIHYQDQSDDEDEKCADWKKRKGLWNRLLGISGVPSAAGFSYDFLNDDVIWEYYNKNIKLMRKEVEEKKQTEIQKEL
jgi:hypothetical protein